MFEDGDDIPRSMLLLPRNALFRTKFLLAFLALIVLAAAPGVYSIATFQASIAGLSDIREGNLEALRSVRHLAAVWDGVQSREVKLRVLRATEALSGIETLDRTARATIDQLLKNPVLRSNADISDSARYLEADWDAFLSCLHRESELIQKQKWMDLSRYAADTVQLTGRGGLERIQQLRDQFEEQSLALTGELESRSRRAAALNLICLAGALIVSILLAAVLAESMTRPLSRLKLRALRMSKGDFGEDVPVRADDEIGKLTRAFNYMQTRLKELDQMKSEFISVASHELRNPVMILSGYIEMMQAGMLGDAPAKMRESLDTAKRESDRLLRMVEQLLDLSKIQGGMFALNKREIDPAQLAKDMVRAFQGHEWARKNQFTADIPDRLSPAVWDADRVREVIDNLFSNACKFSPALGRIQFRVFENEQEIHFSITDDGPGIPEDKLDRIFDKFYQIESGTGRKVKGLGLGLALVKGIVESHGGTVRATSRVGEGTTVTATFPLRYGLDHGRSASAN